MRNLILIVFCLNAYAVIFGQISAITQHGEKVILYDDYTWRYADDDPTHFKRIAISEIDVDSNGLADIEFIVAGNRVEFYDGKLFFDKSGPTKLDYHNNSYFSKSVGKIRLAEFGNLTIEFEYHQNFIFDKSEGKIKSIRVGNEDITFEYHEISFFEHSVGKLKSISKNGKTVNFEYHQNSIYPENEGKLKEISGEIPGIRIRYLD
jgi:hypothetical protein